MIYKSPNTREVIIANIEELVPKNRLLRKKEIISRIYMKNIQLEIKTRDK